MLAGLHGYAEGAIQTHKVDSGNSRGCWAACSCADRHPELFQQKNPGIACLNKRMHCRCLTAPAFSLTSEDAHLLIFRLADHQLVGSTIPMSQHVCTFNTQALPANNSVQPTPLLLLQAHTLHTLSRTHAPLVHALTHLMIPHGTLGSSLSGSSPSSPPAFCGMASYSRISCSREYKMRSRNLASGTGCTAASGNHLVRFDAAGTTRSSSGSSNIRTIGQGSTPVIGTVLATAGIEMGWGGSRAGEEAGEAAHKDRGFRTLGRLARSTPVYLPACRAPHAIKARTHNWASNCEASLPTRCLHHAQPPYTDSCC